MLTNNQEILHEASQSSLSETGQSTLSRICRRTCRFSIELPLLLFMTASFLHTSVWQAFLYTKTCQTLILDPSNFDFNRSTNFCDNSTLIHNDFRIQTAASHLYLIISVCQTLVSIPATILLGAYGDKKSRKLAIMLPLLGAIMCDVSNIVQSSYSSLSAYWLLLSDLVFGLLGGFPSVLSTMFSYASAESIRNEKNTKIASLDRSSRMASLEGAIGIGSAIGFTLSVALNTFWRFQIVFIVEVSLHTLACIYVIVKLHDIETKPVQNLTLDNSQKTFNCVRYCYHTVLDYVTSALSVLWLLRRGYARRILLLTLMSFFISTLIFLGTFDIAYLYLYMKLSWSVVTYSYYMGITSALATLVVIFLYPFARRRYFSDCSLAIAGVVSRMIGCLTLCFPISTTFVFASSIFNVFNKFAAVGMRTIVSKHVPLNEQNQVFAAVSLLESFAYLAASAVFNALYPATIHVFAGLPFIFMTVLALCPLFVLVYVKRLLQLSADVSALQETEVIVDPCLPDHQYT